MNEWYINNLDVMGKNMFCVWWLSNDTVLLTLWLLLDTMRTTCDYWLTSAILQRICLLMVNENLCMTLTYNFNQTPPWLTISRQKIWYCWGNWMGRLTTDFSSLYSTMHCLHFSTIQCTKKEKYNPIYLSLSWGHPALPSSSSPSSKCT